MKKAEIVDLLDQLYRGGRNPHDANPSLDGDIRNRVRRLCEEVAATAGTRPEVRGPANLDSFHWVSWPLRAGLPPDPADIDVASLAEPALYLTARVCHFARLVELSWLEIGNADGKPYRRSAELLDRAVLQADPRTEAVALAALQAAEDLGLDVLSWEILSAPAAPDWPRQFWMPDAPQIRNFLFPGFFEIWPE